MFRWWRHRQASLLAKEMGMDKGIAVAVRRDGSVDVDVEDKEGNGWNTNNLSVAEAEYLYIELGRAIARQKERGFPKTEPSQLPA